MRYCTRCVQCSTRPDLAFDAEGVCSACRTHEAKPAVDWAARHREFAAILDRYRRSDSWDCVVAASGGKDSVAQVIRVLEHGMHPLVVTWAPDDPSDLGLRNVAMMRRLGVDHIYVTPNVRVRARLNRLALETVGDWAWPDHLGIFSAPVAAAVAHNIPLIIYGENPQSEMGGPAGSADSPNITRAWLAEFGGLLGMRLDDVPALCPEIQPHQLAAYRYPSDADMARVGVTGIFLGHYLGWDGQQHATIAQAHGWESFPHACEGSLVNWENLDNCQCGGRDYFMYLKYGFGRATTQASLLIRRGRLTRTDAARLVVEREGHWPATYLGKPLADILAPLDLTVDDFRRIADKFTNRDLFELDGFGELRHNPDGSPVRRFRP